MYYEHVLRPVVQKGQKVDRIALSLTKNDLEWKMANPSFGQLPFKTRDAYQNFRGFIETLETATDEQIEASRDVLEGLFVLGISCHVHGKSMADLYKGRNPCREAQYKSLIAVGKAEGRESSPLVEAARRMIGTCLKCPYR